MLGPRLVKWYIDKILLNPKYQVYWFKELNLWQIVKEKFLLLNNIFRYRKKKLFN